MTSMPSEDIGDQVNEGEATAAPSAGGGLFKIEPSCKCKSCTDWNISSDWCANTSLHSADQRLLNSKISPKKKNASPRLIATTASPPTCLRRRRTVVSFNYKSISKLKLQTTYNGIFVHGDSIPIPIERLADAPLHHTIAANMHSPLNYRDLLTVQTFAWPSILRQLHTCIISGPKTGKTMSYLPILCSFVLDSHKHSHFARCTGPLAIILCPNSSVMQDVYELAKKLVSGPKHQLPKVALLTYPMVDVSAVDIVISMAGIVSEYLDKNLFNLIRLNFLVLEEADLILKRDVGSLLRVLKISNEMLRHRSVGRSVQMIMTSTTWTKRMEDVVSLLATTPTICFGNYLEAALYARIPIEYRDVDELQKKNVLLELIQHSYKNERTIVFCHPSSIDTLSGLLECANIKLNIIHTERDSELEVKEREWNAPVGDLSLLICTDTAFTDCLAITNAQFLIHFDLPHTWNEFAHRFQSVCQYFHSPLNTLADDNLIENARSIILCHATVEEPLYRIFHLLQRVNDKNMEKEALNYLERKQSALEYEKIRSGVALCEELKLMGVCSNSLCRQRHQLCRSIDDIESLPNSGVVQFKIIDAIDVHRYSIELVQWTDPDDNIVRYGRHEGGKALKLQKDELDQIMKADELTLGLHIAYYDALINNYFSGEIVRIENRQSVVVKNLFTGIVARVSCTSIRYLPERYRKLQTVVSVVDMILSGVMPPYKDMEFSDKSRVRVANILGRAKGVTLSGRVLLRLGTTLWLDDIMERVQVKDVLLNRFNLIKTLTSEKIVEINPQQMVNLQRHCIEANIYMEPIKVQKRILNADNQLHESNRHIQPYQWAFLDYDDDIIKVDISYAFTPHCFFVRLSKFDKLLDELERDMTASADYVTNKEIELSIGHMYMVKNELNGLYIRVMILDMDETRALCYYVDYGDDKYVPKSKVKFMQHKFTTRLPFQAIQCSLYGIKPVASNDNDQWNDAAMEQFFDLLDVRNSNNMYVKLCNEVIHDLKKDIRVQMSYEVLLLYRKEFTDEIEVCNATLVEADVAEQCAEWPQIPTELVATPEAHDNGSDADSDEEATEQKVFDGRTAIRLPNERPNGVDMSQMDCVLFDEEIFMKSFENKGYSQSNTDEHSIRVEEIVEPQPPALSAHSNPATDTQNENYLTPTVLWSQNNENVTVRIQLINVEDYDIKILKGCIFKFRCTVNNSTKVYVFSCTLSKPVEKDYTVNAKGMDFAVTLKKRQPAKWSRLCTTKLRNVRYLFSATDFSEYEDSDKRKRLALDLRSLPADAEEGSDSDGELVLVESDQDSEFEEIIESESD